MLFLPFSGIIFKPMVGNIDPGGRCPLQSLAPTLIIKKSNIPCSICIKLHTFDQSPGLKTYMPISSYSHSATSWHQEVWHIKMICALLIYIFLTTLKANYPPFIVSLKHPDGGVPGCEGPFNTALILKCYVWGSRAQKIYVQK